MLTCTRGSVLNHKILYACDFTILFVLSSFGAPSEKDGSVLLLMLGKSCIISGMGVFLR